MRWPWLQAEMKVATILGINLLLLLSSFFFPPLFKTPERVVVGFQILAWAPSNKKIRIPMEKNIRGHYDTCL